MDILEALHQITTSELNVQINALPKEMEDKLDKYEKETAKLKNQHKHQLQQYQDDKNREIEELKMKHTKELSSKIGN